MARWIPRDHDYFMITTLPGATLLVLSKAFMVEKACVFGDGSDNRAEACTAEIMMHTDESR